MGFPLGGIWSALRIDEKFPQNRDDCARAVLDAEYRVRFH